MNRSRIHFVTGTLAAPALRRVLEELSGRAGFDYSLEVLKINVAALLTAEWIARHWRPPPDAERVILPGYCRGELAPLAAAAGVPVELGPKDLHDLPEHFGGSPRREGYGRYDIEILAEINHAPRLARHELLAEAERLAAAGADVIDLGCEPEGGWNEVGEAVRALVDAGRRVSIDSYDPREIGPAVRAGAELVLSVNAGNRAAAADWNTEVVAVPDTPDDLDSLAATVEFLERQGVRYRLDPILEPIGFGFAASLERYAAVRRRWPAAEILMGIGNLTELTDVDSAGLNVALLALCQEWGIRSVLTTQVIPWARHSVRECDLARRLVYHAVRERALPKRLDARLVQLGDVRRRDPEAAELDSLADRLKDQNYRLFVAEGKLQLVAGGLRLSAEDPFDLFQQLWARQPKNLDAGHAFYLGYELHKALTALTLDKQYQQDEALDWGYRTRPESGHRANAPGERPA